MSDNFACVIATILLHKICNFLFLNTDFLTNTIMSDKDSVLKIYDFSMVIAEVTM